MGSQIFPLFHVAISLIAPRAAPTQSYEPAFAASQGAALLLFIVTGTVALRRFRPGIFA